MASSSGDKRRWKDHLRQWFGTHFSVYFHGIITSTLLPSPWKRLRIASTYINFPPNPRQSKTKQILKGCQWDAKSRSTFIAQKQVLQHGAVFQHYKWDQHIHQPGRG